MRSEEDLKLKDGVPRIMTLPPFPYALTSSVSILITR
jgi:hypothetical protein